VDALGCGFRNFTANALWMHIGLLAYNLVCWLRLLELRGELRGDGPLKKTPRGSDESRARGPRRRDRSPAQKSARRRADSPSRWQTRTWRTRFFTLPGYLARSGRQFVLKLAASVSSVERARGLAARIAVAYG